MEEEKTSEVKRVYDGNTEVIVTPQEILVLDTLDMSSPSFEKGVAYVQGEYFYSFKGNYPFNPSYLEPGIYFKDGKYILLPAVTSDEQDTHRIKNYLMKLDTKSIKESLESGKEIIISLPESTKAFIPPITKSDDILKRALKKALIEKNIDIDQYRERFIDKNALFNFKQVIKGDAKLSMLLFERGAEALKLKYRIIIEEEDPDATIGKALKENIVVSSEDTYDL